ncbi:MAG: hypothetical protein EZS28_008821 [Streblomastix strix]|uniref:Uncharacterized protein n=1 Tax=Streblomastix strix TaxID=222440 RepID=A0A5J4WM66_9EUKA|nr:MAG: hypothetical protein EZS28_008821 [Streblomastix strix]
MEENSEEQRNNNNNNAVKKEIDQSSFVYKSEIQGDSIINQKVKRKRQDLLKEEEDQDIISKETISDKIKTNQNELEVSGKWKTMNDGENEVTTGNETKQSNQLKRRRIDEDEIDVQEQYVSQSNKMNIKSLSSNQQSQSFRTKLEESTSEQKIGMSTANALKMLQQRGILNKNRDTATDPLYVGDRQTHMQQLSSVGVQPISRSLIASKANGSKGSINALQSANRKNISAAEMQPEDFADIDVEHYDIKGRLLSQKEAWREYAQEFHDKKAKPKKQYKHELRAQQNIYTARAVSGTGDARLPTDLWFDQKQASNKEAGVEFHPVQVAIVSKKLTLKESKKIVEQKRKGRK